MTTTIDGTAGVTFPDATLQARGGARQLAQIQTSVLATVSTGTTVVPFDNTIPQNTEGNEYLSLAITPTNTSSTLEIDVVIYVASSAASNGMTAALFQDSTANALAAGGIVIATATHVFPIVFKHIVTAGTTSATTFKVRAGGGSAGTTTVNGSSGAQLLGGVYSSRITIKEYLP